VPVSVVLFSLIRHTLGGRSIIPRASIACSGNSCRATASHARRVRRRRRLWAAWWSSCA
jgi:hypothetical protein